MSEHITSNAEERTAQEAWDLLSDEDKLCYYQDTDGGGFEEFEADYNQLRCGSVSQWFREVE